jgi:hypothetical protein
MHNVAHELCVVNQSFLGLIGANDCSRSEQQKTMTARFDFKSPPPTIIGFNLYLAKTTMM